MMVTLNEDGTIRKVTEKQSTGEGWIGMPRSEWDKFPFRLICGNPAGLLEEGFFVQGFFNAADVLNGVISFSYIDCRDAEAQRLLDNEIERRRHNRAE